MGHAPREDDEPWYKQFWPWFIISIPAATVVAAMFTIKLAVETSDGLVHDDYYKEGLAISKDVSRERLAKVLKIEADIDIHPETRELRLNLLGKITDQPKTLDLEFFHPTMKGQDHSLKLIRAGDMLYMSRLPEISPAKWRLTLMPENKEWKVTGRLKYPQLHTVRLD